MFPGALHSSRLYEILTIQKSVFTPMSKTLSRRSVLFILVALLLLLSLLSMRVMRAESFWYDEIWSIKCAGGAHYGPVSLPAILECVRVYEANPPGYHIVLWLWGTAVGWSEFALWMLSLLVGLVTVASMYRLGLELFAPMDKPSGRRIGLYAAIVFSLSAFYLQFFYELRVYVFIVLGTIWFIGLYWRLRHRSHPAIFTQALFVLTIAGLLYLHFLTVLIFAPVALYHLVAVKKDRLWWRIPILMVAGALLFLPWIPVLLKVNDVVVHPQDFRRTAIQMAQLVAYTYSNSNIGLVAMIGIFALVPLALKQPAMRFLWSAFVVGLIGALTMVELFSFINRARYLLHLWPLAALILALALELLRRRRVSPVFFFLIWGAAGFSNYLNPTIDNVDHNLRLPWRSLQAELQSHSEKGDVILFHTPLDRLFETLELEYYTHGLPIRGSLTENIPGKPEKDDYFNEAKRFVGNTSRLWLGVDQSSQPNFRLGEVKRILDAEYAYCYTAFNFPWQMRLELYARKPSVPAWQFINNQNHQINVSLSGALKVDDEKTLDVVLSMSHSGELPPYTYSVALHVEDEQGQLRAQGDFGVPPEPESCHRSTISLKGLPPGRYTLRTIVYEWRNGQRLTGQTLATGTSEERPIAGTIELR